MRKFKMECFCNGGKGGRKAREIHGGEVVVRGGKVCLGVFFLRGGFLFKGGF